MYLITGATGHIGNTLIRELLQKDPTTKIRALVLPNSDLASLTGLAVEIAYGNVLDPSTLDKAMVGIDLVFHLAGIISIRTGNDELTEKVNIQGAYNVGLAALKVGVSRMVHVASIHVFERLPTGVIDETTPLVTRESAAGVYDYTKAEAVRRLFRLVEDGLDVVIACPTGVIGPNDYLGSEMGKRFRAFMTEPTHVSAKGGYNWVDVRDVAQGLLGLMAQGEVGELYILGGHYIGVGEFADYVGEAMNRSVEVRFLPYPLLLVLAYLLQFMAGVTGKEPELTPYALRTLRDNVNFSYQKALDCFGYVPRPAGETMGAMLGWYSQNKLPEG